MVSTLSFEQQPSALERLHRLKLRHGCRTRLTAVVGLKENGRLPHLAFCPALFVRPEALSLSGGCHRYRSIDGAIRFRNAEEVARVLQGRIGFAFFRAEVLSQDGIVSWTIDPRTLRVTEVERWYHHLLAKHAGREMAREVLASLAY